MLDATRSRGRGYREKGGCRDAEGVRLKESKWMERCGVCGIAVEHRVTLELPRCLTRARPLAAAAVHSLWPADFTNTSNSFPQHSPFLILVYYRAPGLVTEGLSIRHLEFPLRRWSAIRRIRVFPPKYCPQSCLVW